MSSTERVEADAPPPPSGPEPSAEVSGEDRRTGRRVLRWLVLAVLAVAWVVLLFTVVFPRLEQVFNTDPTLEGDAPASDTEPAEQGDDVAELPGEG